MDIYNLKEKGSFSFFRLQLDNSLRVHLKKIYSIRKKNREKRTVIPRLIIFKSGKLKFVSNGKSLTPRYIENFKRLPVILKHEWYQLLRKNL